MPYINSDAKMIQRRQEQGSGLTYLVDSLTNSDLTLRLPLSYTSIYGAPILDVSRSHTTTQNSR
jgi:hypothetical protein